jgi:hypothetical protein
MCTGLQTYGLLLVSERVLKVLEECEVLEKCASLTCSAVFRHQGNGMLLRVPLRGKLRLSGTKKKAVAVEHFWLCSHCAETMTFGIDRDLFNKVTVKVIPLSSNRDAAA